MLTSKLRGAWLRARVVDEGRLPGLITGRDDYGVVAGTFNPHLSRAAVRPVGKCRGEDQQRRRRRRVRLLALRATGPSGFTA